jgi:hypothetical protein
LTRGRLVLVVVDDFGDRGFAAVFSYTPMIPRITLAFDSSWACATSSEGDRQSLEATQGLDRDAL